MPHLHILSMTNPLCKICDTPVTQFVKSTNNWRVWCSNKCMGSDPDILAKKADTNMKKFGVSHPMKLVVTRDQIKQTNLARHGYEHPFADKTVQDKFKQVNLTKYGVDNPAKNSDIRKKISSGIAASYEKNKEVILSKRGSTNIDRYGVATNKHFHIPAESIELMKDVDWMRNQHEVLKKSCQQIADELGVSATPILTFMHDNDIKVARHPVSIIEIEIRDFVSTLTTDSVVYNDRSVLFPRELDIWIPSKQLAIEVNGVYWHAEERGKDRNYHVNKTQQCEQQGIHLLQIYDSEWLDPVKQLIIKSKLEHIFGKSKRIYARQCVIRNVTIDQATVFLTENHLQGACPARHKLGLYYQDKLIALATLGVSRFNKNYDLELLRYCNLRNHSVIGGLSKLLSHVSKYIQVSTIISYADRRWTANLNANLYNASGFSYLQTSAANYKYFKVNSSKLVLLSRNQFQKHMLADKLSTYDTELTEYANMSKNGYYRIWDCGNLVYIWTNKNKDQQ